MKWDGLRTFLEPITSMLPKEQLEHLQAFIQSVVFFVTPCAYFLGLYIFHVFLYDHGISGTQTLFKASYLITGLIFMIIAGLNFALFFTLFQRFAELAGSLVGAITRRESEQGEAPLWPLCLYRFVLYLGLLVVFEVFGPIILDISSASDVKHVDYDLTSLNPFHFFSVICAGMMALVAMLMFISSKFGGLSRQALSMVTRLVLLIGVLFVSFTYAEVLYPELSPLVGGGLPVNVCISLRDAKVTMPIDFRKSQQMILRNDDHIYLDQRRNDTVVEISVDQVASIQYLSTSRNSTESVECSYFAPPKPKEQEGARSNANSNLPPRS